MILLDNMILKPLPLLLYPSSQHGVSLPLSQAAGMLSAKPSGTEITRFL
eukprot:CAMPEP_0178447066 /NCGR_PEP_ID=MMETSP0689_2-20121128/41172_1 /TAXON_ID=160604 /ORGANISM="Amphidinium massartii, Strain CS-259" /LENGTH=48 /DNA_ID= /DNA_START= /DNA_END= /DNA_ORIENTATION=